MIEPEIEYTAFVQEDTDDGMKKVLDMLRFDQILATPWTIDTKLMEKYLKAIRGSSRPLQYGDPLNYCSSHNVLYDDGSSCSQCRAYQLGSMDWRQK